MATDRFSPSAFPADNPLMPRLYQAAIGPLHTAYYRQLFERFDALGKPLPSWNWAAGCCTLGWMALRGLWLPAAVYAALVLAVALLWWALGLHTVLPRPAAGALALFLVLLAVVVPGLGGNALYHRSVRARTMHALTDSTTLGQAMEQLQAKAPTPARLQWAASGQALALVLAGALVWWANSSPSASSAAPRAAAAASGTTQEDMARALAALSPAAAPAATPAPPEVALVPETAAAAAAVTAVVASAAPVPAAAPASAPAASEKTAAASAAPAPAALPLKADLPTPPAKAEKAGKSTRTEKAEKPEKREKATAAAPAAKPVKTASTAKTKPAANRSAAATALQPGKYYLNSGIYAQSDNARRAAGRLRNEGLPVFTQTLESRKGEVTRVRVGPFDSHTQAEAAAQQAQALQLEGQVFRHRAE